MTQIDGADIFDVRRSGVFTTSRPMGGIGFRTPRVEDGAAVWRLVAACPPLDANSLYCNLLQCSHFAETCLLAERGKAIWGWVSAYRPPSHPDTLFVWQVAVHPDARGCGLGRRMLNALIALPAAAGVTNLQTTVTPSNHASRRLFTSFAAQHGLTPDIRPGFDREAHLNGTHETEDLFSIGPFAGSCPDQETA